MDPREPRPRRHPGEKPAPRPRPEAPELFLAVVEWLEKLAPEPIMDPMTHRSDVTAELWYAMGKRNLAQRVRAEYTRQNEES